MKDVEDQMREHAGTMNRIQRTLEQLAVRQRLQRDHFWNTNMMKNFFDTLIIIATWFFAQYLHSKWNREKNDVKYTW